MAYYKTQIFDLLSEERHRVCVGSKVHFNMHKVNPWLTGNVDFNL